MSAVLAWRGRLRKKTSGCSEVLGCKEVAGPGKGLGEGGVYEGVVIPGGNVCRDKVGLRCRGGVCGPRVGVGWRVQS